jgi:DNA integrity scanning protein DisA with diadenylate cyclase activity/mannitol/fructose-specific phosphotransferase system IIA component (Ntr-type)
MGTNPLEDTLSPARIVFLHETNRHGAIGALVERLSEDVPGIDMAEVSRRVFAREETMSSRISREVAAPHAVVEGLSSTWVVLGLSKAGIPWEPHSGERVTVVVLLVGGPEQHLEALSAIAARLHDSSVYQALLVAETPEQAYAAIAESDHRLEQRFLFNDTDVSRLAVEQAAIMAERLAAARLVIHADAINDADYLAALAREVNAILITTQYERFADAKYHDLEIITLPVRGTRRSTNVKFGLLYLLSQGMLSRNDVVVNVYGLPGSGYFDSVRLTHIGSEFDLPVGFQDEEAPSDVAPHVLTRTLQLVSTLAGEGREGKPIGTMFILGDYDGVRKHAHQLIVNPFQGYPEDQRNILDPNLEETIKEYAKIDGAFVVRGDGVVASAGTFVQGDATGHEHHSGLGARHAAALSLSGATRAMAIVLSESTRRVSVFHGGRRLVFF